MKHEPLIGIRREDKNEWERRVPLTPEQVSRLVEEEHIRVALQPSQLRAFPDQDYAAVGAEVKEDLEDCPVVLGVKEMPEAFFRQGGSYVFFAHVIKGQPYNMGMLSRMMDLACNLVDYEKILDDQGRRLVFFGRFAGIAGMTNTLLGLGRRLEQEGLETPFSRVKQAREYARVDIAKSGLEQVGKEIGDQGLPEAVVPLVIGIAGYGHVAQGALEMLAALGAKEVGPEDLPGLAKKASDRACYYSVFREEHMVEPADPNHGFDLQDYYQHPERYQPRFDRQLPLLTALVNCIYWDKRYPRLVTRDWLQANAGTMKLRVIGDISCDVRGAIEATVKTTNPGQPFFTYDPATGAVQDGLEGRGVAIMAVDNLPCELPFGSSREFGIALSPLVPALARADFSQSLAKLALPAELKRGLILHQGKLTPEFEYIQKFLRQEGNQQS